jgi:hypothetical protein
MDHKWKQLTLVVNFLFGLRVNEILNKTFILDSHQPFICSVGEAQSIDWCYQSWYFEKQRAGWGLELKGVSRCHKMLIFNVGIDFSSATRALQFQLSSLEEWSILHNSYIIFYSPSSSPPPKKTALTIKNILVIDASRGIYSTAELISPKEFVTWN